LQPPREAVRQDELEVEQCHLPPRLRYPLSQALRILADNLNVTNPTVLFTCYGNSFISANHLNASFNLVMLVSYVRMRQNS
jgi:hypothetical protein